MNNASMHQLTNLPTYPFSRSQPFASLGQTPFRRSQRIRRRAPPFPVRIEPRTRLLTGGAGHLGGGSALSTANENKMTWAEDRRQRVIAVRDRSTCQLRRY